MYFSLFILFNVRFDSLHVRSAFLDDASLVALCGVGVHRVASLKHAVRLHFGGGGVHARLVW